jgi:hypothetical protein
MRERMPSTLWIDNRPSLEARTIRPRDGKCAETHALECKRWRSIAEQLINQRPYPRGEYLRAVGLR